MATRGFLKGLGLAGLLIGMAWKAIEFLSTSDWLIDEAPGFAKRFKAVSMPSLSTTLFLVGLTILLVLGWLDWLDRRRDRKLAEESQREPAAVERQSEDMSAFIVLGDDSRGNRISDSEAYGPRPFLEIGRHATENEVARVKLYSDVAPQPTRSPVRFAGKRRLKQETLALVNDIYAYLGAKPSHAAESHRTWQEATKAIKETSDENEKERIWNEYSSQEIERSEREGRELAQLFGGEVRYLATERSGALLQMAGLPAGMRYDPR